MREERSKEKKKKRKILVKDRGELLKEVIVKIGLERIDTQKRITVEALLDSGVTELVISSEFTRKQGFKLKKIKRPIYVRNVDGFFNKERPIELFHLQTNDQTKQMN